MELVLKRLSCLVLELEFLKFLTRLIIVDEFVCIIFLKILFEILFLFI